MQGLSAIDRQLLALLADGEFHSGTQLSHQLNVSRTAISKHLQHWSKWGLDVSSITGKGYKLSQPLQLLDEDEIASFLSPRARQILRYLDIHDVIQSTNSHLLDLAQGQPLTGVACLAEYQSGGRGRRGRQWVSPFGHNIYLSIAWQYQHGPAELAGLSLAVGVGVMRALKELGCSDVGVKWPNDIHWRERKLAGILIEVSGESSGPCQAVVGVGINGFLSAEQGASIDQPWVDLRTVLGENTPPQRNHLVALLLNQLLPLMADYQHQSLSEYLDEWRRHDCMRGRLVSLLIGEQRIEGTAVGIDDNGLLLLVDDQGRTKHYASGEISLRAL